MTGSVVERLIPGEVDEAHQRNFALLEPWLRDYYDGYANRDKLIALLSYWLFAYRCLLECYGVEATREYSRRGPGSPLRFAWLAEFGVDHTVPRQKFRTPVLFHAATMLLCDAYLPGGRVRSLYSKVMWRLTRCATANTPLVIDPARKRALVTKLVDYFGKDGEIVMESSASEGLPPAFAAAQVHTARSAELRVDTSSYALMDFSGFENILLIDRRLNIVGRQHGGGYDIFDVDYFIDCEKSLCDTFVGWGMSKVNEHQHRYVRVRDDGRGGDPRVIVVERPLLPMIMYPFSPPIYCQFTDPGPIRYVHAELTAAGTDFYSLVYPGRLQSPAYAGLRGKPLPSVRGRGESVLRPRDVPIFDISAASLIHHCIENDMTFVLVVGRDSEPHFSAPYREWLCVLREAGLAFYDDEARLLRSAISDLAASGYELPPRVREYHHRRFINIPQSAA